MQVKTNKIEQFKHLFWETPQNPQIFIFWEKPPPPQQNKQSAIPHPPQKSNDNPTHPPETVTKNKVSKQKPRRGSKFGFCGVLCEKATTYPREWMDAPKGSKRVLFALWLGLVPTPFFFYFLFYKIA